MSSFIPVKSEFDSFLTAVSWIKHLQWEEKANFVGRSDHTWGVTANRKSRLMTHLNQSWKSNISFANVLVFSHTGGKQLLLFGTSEQKSARWILWLHYITKSLFNTSHTRTYNACMHIYVLPWPCAIQLLGDFPVPPIILDDNTLKNMLNTPSQVVTVDTVADFRLSCSARHLCFAHQNKKATWFPNNL